MDVTPKVSVIVLNWNGDEMIRSCLPSVVASSYPNLEVVIADNASTDSSVKWIAENLPSVRTIVHPENWGFCRGNNEAIKQTESEYVVLMNNDVEVEAGWLEPIIAEMQADLTIGAAQPKLLDRRRPDSFEYAGGSGGHMDRFGYTFVRGRLFYSIEPDQGQYDDATDIFWATGAVIVIRRSVLDVTGLLDERFEFHMEEIDLCWRMQRAGFRIRVVPSSRAYHVGGASLARSSSRKTYFNYRNSLLMLEKNLPPAQLTGVFAVRFLLDLSSLLFALLKLNLADCRAIIRAYGGYLRLRSAPGAYGDVRRLTTKVLPSYRGSIVLDYFIRGKKRFSDLNSDKFQK